MVQQSIASLVMENPQIVQVLEKYSIDFCCRGKGNLADACKEKSIDLSKVLREIEAVQKPDTNKTMPFVEMTQEQLVNHIIVKHHYYVKQAMPAILDRLGKIVKKHGEQFANILEVKELFETIKSEMDPHMQKEELILFPRIIQKEKELESNQHPSFPENYISGPISMMAMEHEIAGDIMFEIRSLTNKYKIPPGACTTFRVCMAELKEFEDDLHKHVHLENNILFPRALQMGLSA